MGGADFEREYVHKFYSQKSSPFSQTRVKPWPFTLAFMERYAGPAALVLDSGCGNGRQFIGRNTVGVDYSENLLRAAAAKPHLALVRADVVEEPFRDRVFDIVLSIAVVHHLSTHERRLRCLQELRRVLKDGGHGLVYAWSIEASKKQKFSPIDGNAFFVSWRGETDALRYYYLFSADTLAALCAEAGFHVLESGVEQESVYAVVRK
ncbi:hypothetical protein PAPHI01_1642 [Pancytospora philotis]|nr:hypothetical protein PAPHI01_1642 [Pancytospora philotis]